MANEIDLIMDDAAEYLRVAFSKIVLNEEEKNFVNGSAKQIEEFVWNLFMGISDEKRSRMRGTAMVFAIAMAIGPWQLSEEGIGFYTNSKDPDSKQKRTP